MTLETGTGAGTKRFAGDGKRPMFEVDRALLHDAATRLEPVGGLRWRFGHGPVLVDGGITHPCVLVVAVDPARIACLTVADAESRRIWEEAEDRAGIPVVERSVGSSVEELSRTVRRHLGLRGEAGVAGVE